jgi:hypothetical protein
VAPVQHWSQLTQKIRPGLPSSWRLGASFGDTFGVGIIHPHHGWGVFFVTLFAVYSLNG